MISTDRRVALYDRASEDDFLGIYQYIMIVNERRTCATMVQQWCRDIQPNSTQHNSIMTISRTASSGARLNTVFLQKWVILMDRRVALYDRASEDDFLGIYQYIMIVNERRTCATMVQQWRRDIQLNSTQHNSITTLCRAASSRTRLKRLTQGKKTFSRITLCRLTPN